MATDKTLDIQNLKTFLRIFKKDIVEIEELDTPMMSAVAARMEVAANLIEEQVVNSAEINGSNSVGSVLTNISKGKLP